MKAKTWLRRMIQSSGKTDAEIAFSVGVLETTLRTWTSRNQVPEGTLEKFAVLFGITAEDMSKNVSVCQNHRRTSPKADADYDILPLIRAIAGSDATSVTLVQLENVMCVTRNFRGPITPLLISELFKAM